jgi:hypothetical protein
MSKYSKRPLDFANLKTVGLEARGGKVKAADFATPYRKGSGVTGWLDSLPHILAGDSFRSVVDAVAGARAKRRGIIWGLGGHVIKCGLAPVLIDLMRRGYATGFALNGAASIHDFEIALAGHTSEDVEAVLPDGRFGAAEETGREMNCAIREGDAEGIGIGEALGKRLEAMCASGQEMRGGAGLSLPVARRSAASRAPLRVRAGAGRLKPAPPSGASLLLQAYLASVPVTVHVAIGTDTPHTHPAADGAAIGSASLRDFRLFCSCVADLNEGGVYLNVGSAVVLPEVFLKAVSALRNLGHPLAGFTTVNFDFLQHYRPRVNVVERPHASSGGAGYAITGHHELMVPLLAAALIERES